MCSMKTMRVLERSSGLYGIATRLSCDELCDEISCPWWNHRRLNERPYFTKTNYMKIHPQYYVWGGCELPVTGTRNNEVLNKLPFYSSKEWVRSVLWRSGIFATRTSATDRKRNKRNNLHWYFEGSTSSIDLRFPLTAWLFASHRKKNGLFPKRVWMILWIMD